MKIFSKILLVSLTISLFQMVIIPNILRGIFFKSNPSNVQKIRKKASEICEDNILWGEKVEDNSITSLICEINRN